MTTWIPWRARALLAGIYLPGPTPGARFARYSTDEMWLVPHFEKMLYDNALLALAYTEAYQQTRRPLYGEIVRRTLDYVLRELRDFQGGFYCGQDADSEGEEGKYYVFTEGELRDRRTQRRSAAGTASPRRGTLRGKISST